VIGCDIASAAIRTAKARLNSALTIAKPGRPSSRRVQTGSRRRVPKGQPRADG
jgi:hypothetical protein